MKNEEIKNENEKVTVKGEKVKSTVRIAVAVLGFLGGLMSLIAAVINHPIW